MRTITEVRELQATDSPPSLRTALVGLAKTHSYFQRFTFIVGSQKHSELVIVLITKLGCLLKWRFFSILFVFQTNRSLLV